MVLSKSICMRDKDQFLHVELCVGLVWLALYHNI